MKSNIDKILPKLQEKYPNVDIALLIKHYFDIAKQEVESFSKPEIAFPWGTLKARPIKIKERIKIFDYLEKEYFEGNPKNLRPRKLIEIQIERNEIKRILEIYEEYKTKGKTSRHFKRDGKQYKREKNNSSEH